MQPCHVGCLTHLITSPERGHEGIHTKAHFSVVLTLPGVLGLPLALAAHLH